MEMAEASISVEQLTCPVCLDLLNDPVTAPCGHSYCMRCITDCWDRTGVYSCPHCRRVFTPRPDFGKNIILTEMIEKLKQIKLQAADPVQSYPRDGNVCDMCIGKKLKAVKSCLMCLKSYCHAHFELHEKDYWGKAHEVIEATSLQDSICRQHNKQLDVFCRSDQQLICSLCTRDEHKKHDTVPAEKERKEKQEQLKISQRNLQNYIRFRKGHLQQLREKVKSHKWSAQTESLAERRAEQLEKEMDYMKRRDAELDEVLKTCDHIQFLQRFQSFSGPDIPVDISDLTSLFSVDDMGNMLKVLELKSKTVLRPRWSSVGFQPSAYTPTTSKPQVWPPTPPKPRPRPLSILLNTGFSTLPKSGARSTTASEPPPWPNVESVFQRYGFTASKSTYGTVTAESKRRSVMLPPESWPGTSTAPESGPKTSTAPDSRFGTSTVTKFGTVTSRADVAPESKSRLVMPPKPEHTTPTAPKSRPRTSTAPESQLRNSIALKFGTVSSRTSILPESRRRAIMPPKLELRTSTAPESQLRTTIVPESQPSTSISPVSQLRTSTSPESQLRTSTSPKSQLRPSTSPKSQLRPSTSPESQLRTSIAPKFGTVTSRTSILPESRRRPIIQPKPERITTTAPELQTNHDLLKELKSKLNDKKQFVA